MKKSGLWGRIGVVTVAVVILVLSLLTLVACNDTLDVDTIEVVSDTVPGVAVVDEFDISQISLTVTLADGTTQKIAAERSMLTAESREALKTPGQKSITLYYAKKTTVVSILLVESGTETVSVTFLDKNGTLLAKKYTVKGEAVIAPTPPAEPGKMFAGWVGSVDGETLNLAKINASTVVYANYSENLTSYTVTFIDYKDNIISTSTVTHGSKITPPSYSKPAELSTYSWGINFSTYTVTNNATFRMSYEYATKTVTYFYAYSNNIDVTYPLLDANKIQFYENVKINTQIQNKTQARALLLDQGGVALTFESWKDEPATIATDTKLVAIVSPRLYTISYEDGFYPDNTVNVGTSFNIPNLAKSKEGYTFNGSWLDLVSGKVVFGTITISANMKLSPIYTKKIVNTKYVVTFSGWVDPITGEDTVKEIILDNTLFGDSIDIDFVTSQVMPQIKALCPAGSVDNYQIDTIRHEGTDVTSEDVTLSEKTGDAAHEFNIIAVDSSLPTKGLVFLLEGNVYTVSGYTGTAVNIYIPATFEGKAVTAIGANVFKDKTVNVQVPASITAIGSNAFENATFLGDFNLLSVESLGVDVFRNAKTKNDKKIKITIEGILTAIPDFTFFGSKNITEVVLPSTVTSIGVSAFEGSDITTLNLSNITSLSNNAFYNSKLTNITNLSKVESVGDYALSGTAIISLNLPKLSTIGKYAFATMEQLTALSIGTNLSLEVGQEKTFDFSCIDNSKNILTITIGEGFNKLFMEESDFTNIEFITSVINLPASWVLCEKIVGLDGQGIADEVYIIGGLFQYIQSINVASGNSVYSSVNGVLFKISESEATLLLYPGNRNGDYTIPATVSGKNVTHINTDAFIVATVNNLIIGENIALDTLPTFESRVSMSLIIAGSKLGVSEQDVEAALEKIVSAFGSTINVYVNGTVEGFATIVSDKGWTKVFMLNGSGTYSVYDATSDLVYSVTNSKATIIYGNKSATTIVVPQKIGNITVNEIMNGAFANYQYLNTLTINATLKGFSNGIIENCPNLANISIAGWETNAEVSINAFIGTAYYNNNNVISLGGKLIGYNNNAKVLDSENNLLALTIVTRENLAGVVTIPDYFFKDSNITSITLPDSVKNIGKYAFQNCVSLNRINLNKVISINEGAFAGSGLTTINLVNVTELKLKAFKGCASLESVVIPNAINNGSLPYGTFEDCIALTAVDMPYVIRFTADEYSMSRAFANCIALEDISFITRLASVPGETFDSCSSIKSVDFTASSATSIGAGAFKNCTALIYLVISSTVSNLGEFAFSGCENLETIKIVGNGGILLASTPWAVDIFPSTANIYINANASRSALSNYDARIKNILPIVTFAFMPNFNTNAPLNMDSIRDKAYLTSAPQNVTFAGYIFDGWYILMGESYTMATFPMLVSDNLVLYAKYYSLTKGSLSDDDVVYDEARNGWAVVKFTNVSADKIYIPETYTKNIGGVDKNYPIVIIYAGAFSACNYLKSITIPEGVKYLSVGGFFADGSANLDGVFNNNLTYIHLPSSLTTITGKLFTNIAGLDIEFGADCNLYMAETSAFEGTKWYSEENTKALSGINKGFILAGRLALKYVLVENKIVIIPSEVIKLNNSLFANNINIEEIRLNDNLMYIGNDCFAQAINLKYVNYISGNSANSMLKELNLSAFAGTKWLADQNMVIVGTILSKYYDYNGEATVVIPDFITEISANAFTKVTLSALQFGANSRLKTIGDHAFLNSGLITINLPETVESIGKGAFQNCKELKTADLSRTKITYLAEDLFSGCVELNTLSLSNKVIAFNKASLATCSKLKNITANGLSVTENLNSETIEGGSGLKDTLWYRSPVTETAQYLSLGKVLVKFIPSSVVGGEEIIATIPSGIETILTRAFASSVDNVIVITKVIIPSSVKVIEANAFINCPALETVEFGTGSLLKTIGESAFNNCIKLSNIVLPSLLETIGITAFMNADILTLTIPDSVKHLGERSFYGNVNLTYLKIGRGVKELGANVFYNCNNLYKVEWTTSEEQLIAIADYIQGSIVNYSTTDYRNYVYNLFKRDAVGKAIRIYMDSTSYNFVANSNPNLDESTELDKQVNAWFTSTTFSLFMAGEYPEITFEDDAGYYMQSFKTEVITSIGTPAKTGNTFVGWYLDTLKTIPLVLPYKVYSPIQLYAKWYENDINMPEDDSNLTFTYDSVGLVYTVTRVETTVTELYIPATVAGKAVKNINLSDNATYVKKLVLTNASNFNGMLTNIFRYFPNLEQLVLLNSGTTTITYKIEDGVVYSSDGTKLIAYIARFRTENEQRVKETVFNIPLAVTEISDYAFINSGLTEITINRNVIKIGYHAFNNGLTTITFGAGINLTSADSTSFENTAWYATDAARTPYLQQSTMGYFYSAGNMLLEYREIAKANNLVMPDKLKNVNITALASYLNTASRNEANIHLMSFANLKLPEFLLKINSYAFKDINISTNIEAGNSLIDVADNVFSNTDFYVNDNTNMLILGKVLIKCVNTATNIVVPEGIVAISNKAFNSSQLISITLPESLTIIGDDAFYSCNRLLSVTIPVNVTSIGKNAFASNTALTSVKFNTNISKLKSIGDKAFNNCSSLTAIEIPQGVESIGNEVFLNCKKLKTVTFDYIERVEDPGTGVTTVTVKGLSKLKTLGAGVFYNCEALAEITIPNGVDIINQETFYNCKAMLSVRFDVNLSLLKTIAARAFYNCIKLGSKIDLTNPSLITVILPNRIETIKENAFENCSGMYGIQLNYNVKSIESYVFYGCVKLAKVSIYSATPARLSENAFTRSTGSVTAYYSLRIYVNTSENFATKRLYQRAWTAYTLKIFQRDELPVLKYIRVVSGAGGSTETVESPEISNDIIINPTYMWGATNYSTWKYSKLSTIILNNETLLPEIDPGTGKVLLQDSITDPRLTKELGVESYQKFEQNGVTYTLLVLDFDYTVLTV